MRIAAFALDVHACELRVRVVQLGASSCAVEIAVPSCAPPDRA